MTFIHEFSELFDFFFIRNVLIIAYLFVLVYSGGLGEHMCGTLIQHKLLVLVEYLKEIGNIFENWGEIRDIQVFFHVFNSVAAFLQVLMYDFKHLIVGVSEVFLKIIEILVLDFLPTACFTQLQGHN